ncbi:MAG: PilT/PilU family type 4a pilus ATPase [Deltaproteobacteria bacterium]|nr:PilT/PilU family type 4a pilus ATPase [Deltaproteobacteria bacterium]
MKIQPVTPDLAPKVVRAIGQTPLFKGLDDRTLNGIAQAAALMHASLGEAMAREGERADAMGLLLNGQARKMMTPQGLDHPVEVGKVDAMATWGEIDLLLGRPRRYTVQAQTPVLALQLSLDVVHMLFERIPAFGLAMSRALAQRVLTAEPAVPLLPWDLRGKPPSNQVFEMLPGAVIARQRIIPLASEGNQLHVGFVDPLSSHGLDLVRKHCPSMELQPWAVGVEDFNRLMRARGTRMDESESDPLSSGGPAVPGRVTGVVAPPVVAAPGVPTMQDASPTAGVVRRYGPRTKQNPKLDALLKRMVAEGASDLHLSANHKPRWRIDGEIYEINEARVLGDDTVMELFEPIMADRSIQDFGSNDADFAYAVPGVARFRCNLFRDRHGVGAVLRQIPDKILTFEQLGLPEAVRKMCDHPKGLVLVTGPTGSGKSTTLAAMIDYINRGRRTHIITLEDPVEFVHKSQKALVNQREVGEHTASFKRALKAALREDPDIVLVGEMRDLETVSLALETANTGHLVFGTLHTATAISTVDRIIDLFPSEMQSQVRAVVAETLKGVIAQTLCRKKGGGRVAALEILVGSAAISNLVREGKNHQIANIMMTAKKMGNQLLNEELEKLVVADKVEFEEALAKSLDKAELCKRFGREYFEV